MQKYKSRINFRLHDIPIFCTFFLILSFSFSIISALGSSNKVYAATSTTLTIATPTLSANTTPGGTAYAVTNVTYSATDTASYTLQATYANASTTALKGETGSTTISGAGTKTGTSMSDNTWGFAWVASTVAETSYGSQTYYTMPAYGTTGTGTSTGRLASGTTASSTTKKLIFAVKFGSTAVTGHYQTNVLLSLVATPKATYNYSIAYNANGGDGKNVPATQTATNQSGTTYSFTVPSTTDSLPTRAGYIFNGWATTAGSSTATYQPGASVSLSSSTPSRILYATWKEITGFGTGSNKITKLQEMTSSVCSNMNVGDSGELYDTRDNQVYTVGKLADNNCWMTQNLRIAGGTVMSPVDTDLNPEPSNSSYGYISSTQTYTLPAQTTGGFSETEYADSAGAEAPMNQQVFNATDNDYGAYYSFCAATAGTCQVGAYADIQPDTSKTGNPTKSPASTTNSSTEASNWEASSSICPKGWRLPYYSDEAGKNSFKVLYDIYPKRSQNYKWVTAEESPIGKAGCWLGGTSTTAGGAFFPAAGDFTAALSGVGKHGTYWQSDTGGHDHLATTLTFTNNNLNADGFNIYGRWYGMSIRCIAK